MGRQKKKRPSGRIPNLRCALCGQRARSEIASRKLLPASGAWIGLPLLWICVILLLPSPLLAQSCTTQAKLSLTLRNGLADAALGLATAVQAGDASKVQTLTIHELASSFGPTANLVHATSAQLHGDTVRVTQVYGLDAANRKPGDISAAEFTCALNGTTSEADFAIPALPPGTYGFAIVEASGSHPWMLSFLLQQEAGQWKMAGFYPHAGTAAGHDGLWYWRAAREASRSKQPWLAWLLYGEAAQLLQPAPFVSSTNLDLLLSEQRTALPPELSAGVGPETPLVVRGRPAGPGPANALPAGVASSEGISDFHFTGIAAQGAPDGSSLDLMLHLQLEAGADPAAPSPVAAKTRNTAAAQALLDAHKELRQEFQNVWVFAESAGHPAFATEQKIADIP